MRTTRRRRLPSEQVEANNMAAIFESGKTGASPSVEALDNKEHDLSVPSVDKIAGDSSKRAGERMKRNEAVQGIFTK